MHCFRSGVTDHFASTENEALELARECVLSWNFPARCLALWPHGTSSQEGVSATPAAGEGVSTDRDSALRAAIAAQPTTGAGQRARMEAIVAALVDGSRFQEFKPGFGPSMATGFASVGGHRVGVVANAHRTMCAAGARKAAHFVSLCGQRNLPLLFLTDVDSVATDSSPSPATNGADAAAAAAAAAATTAAAKGTMLAATAPPPPLKELVLMMRAVMLCPSVKIALTVGRSTGPARYAMCDLSTGADLHFLWPNARVEIEPSPAAKPAAAAAVSPSSALEGSTGEEPGVPAVYSSARLFVSRKPKSRKKETHLKLTPHLHNLFFFSSIRTTRCCSRATRGGCCLHA